MNPTQAQTTSPSSAVCDFLLAELRCADLRGRLWVNEIEAVGVALKAALMPPDVAIQHLAETGALTLVSSRWWP